MASINYKQGARMTLPASTLTDRTAPTWQHRAAVADYGAYTVRFIHITNAALLMAFVVTFLQTDSSMGILRFIQEDTGLPRPYVLGVAMFIMFMEVSFGARDTSPSWRSLAMVGQFLIAVIAAVYWIRGQLSLIGLVTHAGPYLLACLSIVVIAQRKTPLRAFVYAKHALLPFIGILLACLGVGLIVQPDSSINQFIQTRYGLGVLVAIIACLGWGAGQLRFNHIAPWRALRRMIGLYLYTVMVIYLAIYSGGVSSLGLVMPIYLSGLTICVAMIQIQDWAT